MSSLKGKKILYFAPKFFGYENEICKEIESQGGIVRFYDERNNPTSFEKILLRKLHFLMKSKINNYYRSICEKEKSYEPDYVLFISPETVNKESILLLRNTFPKSQFILYMWDSIENKNARHVYQYFDKCLSFDENDCKKFSFKFRPLFYIKEFEKESFTNLKPCKYDFCFIGSVHSDRAQILNKLRKCFEDNNLQYFYYLYVPGKLMFIIRTLLSKDFRELKKLGVVHTSAISKKEISEITDMSNYIIDINHPKQIGLTMRTIEMLGMHRKLLTTNNYISEYDFFNSSNQIVIDRKLININKDRLINGYISVDENINKKYKISTWLEEIFN